MALGKNMKVDRLIPLVDENNVENEKVDIKLDLTDSINELVKDGENSILIDLNLDNEDKKSSSEEVKIEVISEFKEKVVEDIPQTNSQSSIVYENIETDSLKIIFTPSRRKTQKRILINIEGSLTINNVEVLFSKVNVVFDYFDFVEVNLNNVTEIDLTVIQLFHAIRVNYWPQKKYISINAEFSRDDRKLLNSCGFTEFQTQVSASV
jgi:hypothetical protein